MRSNEFEYLTRDEFKTLKQDKAITVCKQSLLFPHPLEEQPNKSEIITVYKCTIHKQDCIILELKSNEDCLTNTPRYFYIYYRECEFHGLKEHMAELTKEEYESFKSESIGIKLPDINGEYPCPAGYIISNFSFIIYDNIMTIIKV